jgi:hypothetical protein
MVGGTIAGGIGGKPVWDFERWKGDGKWPTDGSDPRYAGPEAGIGGRRPTRYSGRVEGNDQDIVHHERLVE